MALFFAADTDHCRNQYIKQQVKPKNVSKGQLCIIFEVYVSNSITKN